VTVVEEEPRRAQCGHSAEGLEQPIMPVSADKTQPGGFTLQAGELQQADDEEGLFDWSLLETGEVEPNRAARRPMELPVGDGRPMELPVGDEGENLADAGDGHGDQRSVEQRRAAPD